MRGRSTDNFRAKILFDCSAKVVSSVRDRCGGIPAAGRAVGPARHARATKWLHLFISRSGNQIRFSTESFSIHVDRFSSSWRSFRTGAIPGKTADCDRGQVHFRLGTRLAGYSVSQDYS
jgi:hypothetical protein